MTPEEFVKQFYVERENLINLYFNPVNKLDVVELIEKLNLNESQLDILKKIFHSVLRDAFYSVLMGLDGEASIGAKQTMYTIYDEENNKLTGGEIEVYAYEYFHGNKTK